MKTSLIALTLSLSLFAFGHARADQRPAGGLDVVCRMTTLGSFLATTGISGQKVDAKSVVRKANSSARRLKIKIAKLKARVAALRRTRVKRSALQSLTLQIADLKKQLRSWKLTLKGIKNCASATLTKLPAGLDSVVEVAGLALDAGQQIAVPGSLTILATGDVTVNGRISADSDRGQSIEIQSTGNVAVSGEITAGHGSTDTGKIINGTTVRSAPGQDGGGVAIHAANISVGAGALLQAGDGGSGEALTSTVIGKRKSGKARAGAAVFDVQAGDGGKGGDVVLDAGEGVITITPNADGTPLIVLGSGGQGGDSTATTVGNTNIGSLQASAGKGGDSGFPRFAASRIDGLTGTTEVLAQALDGAPYDGVIKAGGTLLVLDERSSRIFGGGAGGDAGTSRNGVEESTALEMLAARGVMFDMKKEADEYKMNAAAQCPPTKGTAGRSCNPPKGKSGGNGFFYTGVGESVYCLDPLRNGKGTGNGGSATAEGGDGGRLKILIGLSTSLLAEKAEFGVGITISAAPGILNNRGAGLGGNGGEAHAFAGNGGENGGSGGDASAKGGKGGDAPHGAPGLDFNVTPTVGGLGGLAYARAGEGKDGTSCCPANPGQAGGTGGSAISEGGAGGEGVFAGYGGSAYAISGSGGRGGNGDGPAGAGQAGQVQAQTGVPGDSTFGPPSGSSAHAPVTQPTSGTPGSDGKECAPPTPTPFPTDPTNCTSGYYIGNSVCSVGQIQLSGPPTLRGGSTVSFPTGAPGTFTCVGSPDCVCLLDRGGIQCCLSCLEIGAQPYLRMTCPAQGDNVCQETLFKGN